MKRFLLAVLTALFSILLIVSCATATVPVTRQKPSDIDLTGITKIAILPANFPEDVTETPVQDGILKCASNYRWRTSAQHEISTYLISKLFTYLEKKSTYKIIDNTEIAKCIPVDETAAKDIPADLDSTTIVDAYVICNITNLKSSLDTAYKTQKNSDGSDVTFITETKTLSFDYNLRVYRASDSSLIGEKPESKVITSVESGTDSFFNVKDDKTLALEAIDDTFDDLVHAFVPYIVDEKIVLEKDTSKNPEMNAADKLANKKKYAEAGALYAKIYAGTNLFAAGYDAALMTELSGDLPNAVIAMNALFQASGNPRASAELQRMQRTLADQARLDTKKITGF